MHIYISVDVEGINGICHSSQTQPNESGYENMLQLLHAEVNSVIEELENCGVTKITVSDSHWDMRNLKIELLHPLARLISGSPRSFSMLPLIDELSPDGIIMLGYHSKIGSESGVLGHTYRAKVFRDVKVNDVSVGEFGLNAILATTFDIPIMLVTGDNVLQDEVLALNPLTNFHVSKQAINKYSAIYNSYLENLTNLKFNTDKAFKNKNTWVKLSHFKAPFKLNIKFFCPSMADGACLIKNVKRVNNDTIEFVDDEYSNIFKTMLAVGAIGSTRINSFF